MTNQSGPWQSTSCPAIMSSRRRRLSQGRNSDVENINDELIGQSGVCKEILKEQKKPKRNESHLLVVECENRRKERVQGGGGSDLKTGRWADKHNQEERMSATVSVEARSVCWMCTGRGRAGSEHMVSAYGRCRLQHVCVCRAGG